MNTNYTPKEDTCKHCRGERKSQSKPQVFVFSLSGAKEVSDETKAIAESMAADDSCPWCHGSGKVSMPPYGDGKSAKLSEEKLNELANASTLMQIIGERSMVEAVANQAARITLPDDVIDNFVGYCRDVGRDVTLGQYIMQIAEYAEQLAEKDYGSLTNGMYARARPHKHVEPKHSNTVSVEEIKALQDKIDAINAVSFVDMELTHNGQPVFISKKEREDYAFTGLTVFAYLRHLVEVTYGKQ